MDDFTDTDVGAELRELARDARPDVSELLPTHLAAMVRAGESTPIAARAALPTRRRGGALRRHTRRSLVAVGAACVLVGTTGAALAGALPDSAQDAAADAAQLVGVTLPHGTHRASEHAPRPSSVVTTTETTPTTTVPANHGADVRAVAHDDSTEGREHGKAVSSVASTHGREQSAEHRADHADANDDGADDDGHRGANEQQGGGSDDGRGDDHGIDAPETELEHETPSTESHGSPDDGVSHE